MPFTFVKGYQNVSSKKLQYNHYHSHACPYFTLYITPYVFVGIAADVLTLSAEK